MAASAVRAPDREKKNRISQYVQVTYSLTNAPGGVVGCRTCTSTQSSLTRGGVVGAAGIGVVLRGLLSNHRHCRSIDE